jgi:predicted ribosome quality control (RQC) complex YloA/Tae2 family protein
MDQDTLRKVVDELRGLLPGKFLGRIFQLSSYSLVIDFGLKGAGHLFISCEPASPRLYLTQRKTRDLQRQSIPTGAFAQALKTSLFNGKLVSIEQDEQERIVRFLFSVETELGDIEPRVLVAQLTGRSTNTFLLNADGRIIYRLREIKGDGQQVGEEYEPPRQMKTGSRETPIDIGEGTSPSKAVEEHYSRLESKQAFEATVKQLSSTVRREISKAKKLKANLLKDLAAHGNPDEHKRLGELLMGNVGTAKRSGSKVALKDYYADGMPTIELEVEENKSLQEAAGEYFSRYTKSKRAVEELGKRLSGIEKTLAQLSEKQQRLEEAIASGDEALLSELAPAKTAATTTRRKKSAPATLPGMRHYRSSDGYEVIVGRAARDNDNLTFRVAKPNDLWLHAGDYPGSHVIVRNSTRKEIPHRTILEAAQLAAKFSQAGKDSRVTVHYTPRKFISKPKGAAPGLVRMSTFRSITVEPAENIERQ